MSRTVRAFIAIELPVETRRALAATLGALRSAELPGLRLVRLESIHLTIKFLGEVPASRVAGIASGLEESARGRRPFSLRLEGAGTFPAGGRPRVVWVGVGGDVGGLHSLQRAVEDSMESAGFEREARRYSPHLTVGRFRPGTQSPSKQSLDAALQSALPLQGARPTRARCLTVDGLSLMRSNLTPEGAVYSRLARIPLSDGEAEDAA